MGEPTRNYFTHGSNSMSKPFVLMKSEFARKKKLSSVAKPLRFFQKTAEKAF